MLDLGDQLSKPDEPSLPRGGVESDVEGIGILPPDYLRFAADYGLGVIDGFLYVLVSGAADSFFSLREQWQRQSAALTSLQKDFGVQPKFPPHPAPGGLVPWGITDNGDVCFWRVAGDDPRQWSIVVTDGRMSDWFEYTGSMTAFLAGLLSGAVECEIFPADWPESGASFACIFPEENVPGL